MSDIEKDTVHLVRLALEGKTEDVAALARRLLRGVAKRRPDLAQTAQSVLETIANQATRALSQQPLPVDVDSRLALLRHEPFPRLEVEPTWPDSVGKELAAVVREREGEERLADAGIAPTRSLLFVGPPGVGKTLAARWLAAQTKRPLLTLDLAAVMSSFLGRTGNNIRVVLDFARRSPAVLLLDEFDAIAKRRDDATEVGELKRLVTVLLQAVDDWPSDGMLIAATNHPELLDPAVWRRFDHVVEFPAPSLKEIGQVVARLLGAESVAANKIDTFSALLFGQSFADITRIVTSARRTAIVSRAPLDVVLDNIIGDLSRSSSLETKLKVALEMATAGRSQRDISGITGLSRDTIRKHDGRAKARSARGRTLHRGARN